MITLTCLFNFNIKQSLTISPKISDLFLPKETGKEEHNKLKLNRRMRITINAANREKRNKAKVS